MPRRGSRVPLRKRFKHKKRHSQSVSSNGKAGTEQNTEPENEDVTPKQSLSSDLPVDCTSRGSLQPPLVKSHLFTRSPKCSVVASSTGVAKGEDVSPKQFATSDPPVSPKQLATSNLPVSSKSRETIQRESQDELNDLLAAHNPEDEIDSKIWLEAMPLCSDPLSSTAEKSHLPTQQMSNSFEETCEERIVVDQALIHEANMKLAGFLHDHWITYVKDGGMYVLYLSRKAVKEVQRQLFFQPNGEVGLAVHGEELNIHSYLTLSNSTPLTPETTDKFVQRCVTIVNEVRNMEICSGCSDVEFKSVWKDMPNAQIDKNPYKEDRYNETLRSETCSLLIPTRKWRCDNCNRLKDPLIRKAAAYEKEPHPNTPNIALSGPQMLHKLSQQQVKINDYKRRLEQLEEKMQYLLETEGVNLPEEDSDDLAGILKNANLTETQSFFLHQQIKASKAKKPCGVRWHPSMIRFALALHMKSSSAYQVARQSGLIKLPSQRTLYDYTHVNSAKEGIDDSILGNVSDRISKMPFPYQQYHVLICDEMHICQNLVFKKSTGQMIGYTNLSEAANDVANLEAFLLNSKTQPELAVKVLSFMIKGVSNDVKEVVASYSIKNLTAELLYSRTSEVINRCERAGIAIVVFVSDGFTVNRAFMKKNKCVKLTKSGLGYACVNKSAPDRLLYFMSDVAHLLKTIRNCLNNSRCKAGTKRCLEKGGEKMLWQSIIDLYNAKKNNDLRKSYKLTAQNVFINSWSGMKVKYAAQILSKTVAKDLEDMSGPKTKELVSFIRWVNDWFDCLNGAHTYQGRRTRNENLSPYKDVNDPRFVFLLDFLTYLSDWKEEVHCLHSITNKDNLFDELDENYAFDEVDENPGEDENMESMEDLPPQKKLLAQATLDGTEISTCAFIDIVKSLLSEKTQYVNARVFSQDHLEQFFSKQRRRGGPTGNPNLGTYLQNCINIHIQGQLGVTPKRGNTEVRDKPMEITDRPLKKLKR